MGTWPGPSIITWQPCSRALSVSSPRGRSSANWASAEAAARQPGGRPAARGADRSGAAAGEALRSQRQVLQEDAGVDRLVVRPLLRLVLDHPHEVVRRQVFDALHLRDGLVDGHGADGDGGVIDDRLADAVDFAAGGEVHDGVGAVVDGVVGLLHPPLPAPRRTASVMTPRLAY